MKANRLRWFLLLVLGSAVCQFPAQQSEAARELGADIRAKAEKGDAKSQWVLGNAFELGFLGVAKDYVEAAKWYRRAAEQGFAMAQNDLGVCYRNGEGVTRDAVEGAKWYRQAAKQGDATAQYYLGACYVQGEGVAKDYVEGHKWFSLAGHQGVENAKTNLFLVEKEMTTEQIAEAQRLAREFKPHKTPEPGAFPLRQRAKL
jgi:TPR repeat protein